MVALLSIFAFVPKPTALRAETLVVRIAVPAPLSGPYRDLGERVRTAAARAAAHLSAAEPTARPSLAIDIVPVDDPCSSRRADRAGDTVIAAKVDAVIGFPCRATALGVAPAFARAGQLLITTAPLIPPYGLTQTGPTVFRMPVAERSHGTFLGAAIAADAPPGARIALVRDRTQLSITLGQAVEAALKAQGRQLAATELFAGGDKTFTAMAAGLKAQGVTHVALVAFAVEGALIARELTVALPDVVLFGPDHLATADFPLIAGEAASRLRIVLPASDPLGLRASQPKLYQALSQGVDVPSREALTVATALGIYVSAVRRVRSTDAKVIAAALREAQSAQATAPAAFDDRGAMVVPYWALWRWHDGRLVEHGPRP